MYVVKTVGIFTLLKKVVDDPNDCLHIYKFPILLAPTILKQHLNSIFDVKVI